MTGRLALYLQLIRWDRPAGWLLLLWPTLSALWVLAQIGGTIPVREILVAHLPGLDESRLPPPLA